MSRISTPVIDCTSAPDLLAGWPMAEAVRLSATAQALMDDLDADWVLEGADLDGKGFAIDADAKTITLDTGGLSKAAITRSHYFRNMMVLRTFAAIRAAWQSERVEDARDMHRPDTWLLLGRIFEADMAVMATRMAFEARSEGDDSLWRHALGDDCADIAMSYMQRLEREPFAENDFAAMTTAFAAWFAKDTRITAADAHTLAAMDAVLADLTMEGRGRMSDGAIRCLTIDPLSGASYLGAGAANIAGDPAWGNIANPVTEAHFLQVIGDIGTVRMGAVGIRDKKLAARLFPDMLVTV